VGGTQYINDAMFGTRGTYSYGVGFIGTMDTAQTCLQVAALVIERQIYTYVTGSNALGNIAFNYETITNIEIEGYTSGSLQYSLTSLLASNEYPRPSVCQPRATTSISPVAIPD
jgi:hypothetical protein